MVSKMDDFSHRGFNSATEFWALVYRVRDILAADLSSESVEQCRAMVQRHGYEYPVICYHGAYDASNYGYFIGDGLDKLCYNLNLKRSRTE